MKYLTIVAFLFIIAGLHAAPVVEVTKTITITGDIATIFKRYDELMEQSKNRNGKIDDVFKELSKLGAKVQAIVSTRIAEQRPVSTKQHKTKETGKMDKLASLRRFLNDIEEN